MGGIRPQSPGNPLLFIAGLMGFLAVGIGALGAHALKHTLSTEGSAWFKTAFEYHLGHALAMAILALAEEARPMQRRIFRLGGGCFAIGILLFSGSLYALALGAPKSMGHITPMGGLSLLLGWAFLALGAYNR